MSRSRSSAREHDKRKKRHRERSRERTRGRYHGHDRNDDDDRSRKRSKRERSPKRDRDVGRKSRRSSKSDNLRGKNKGNDSPDLYIVKVEPAISRSPGKSGRQDKGRNQDNRMKTVEHSKVGMARSDDIDDSYELITEEDISNAMGFSGFASTKGKWVPSNINTSAVRLVTKRKYRQYMNRPGGFNKPLDMAP